MTTLSAGKEPLLGQRDMSNLRVAADRVLSLSGVAPHLGRNLTPGERQLLSLCDVICELIRGSLGEDGRGEPVGDLTLRAQPYAPTTYQPKLRGNGR